MDKALQAELEVMKYVETINEAISQGDTPIQQFYKDTTVFVTGSSGFIGKHLVEKLFRSCQIKKMYLLLRSKKGKTIQERLNYMLSDPLYDVLRERKPTFAARIIPVEGDVADLRLGLSDKDWETVTKEVDTVFHLAATVRFDEPLRTATLINVRGTRETLELAKACPHLKNFVHVSTAFCHATNERVGQDIFEQFYPSPVPPEVMIGLAENLDNTKMDAIAMGMIKGWPNTYTFTKAIAEEAVRTIGRDLPICVLRPPIVCSSFFEPKPGWLDLTALSGPCGITAAIIMGVLHVFYVNKHCKMAITPIDYVNNATIAAGWDAASRNKDENTEIPVYTISNKNKFITWDFIGVRLRAERNIPSPKAVWYCYLFEVQNMMLYGIVTFFLHYIPAFIMDIVLRVLGKMPKEIPSFVGTYRKIDKMASIYDYFLSNTWGFEDYNVQSMLNRMGDADKIIYNCDLKTYDLYQYVKIWGLGIRRYIIKDNLEGSEDAIKYQKWFRIANFFLIAFYLFLVFLVIRLCWNVFNYFI